MTFGAIMKTILFRTKLRSILFGQLYEKFWQLFILTSGHTGREFRMGQTLERKSTNKFGRARGGKMLSDCGALSFISVMEENGLEIRCSSVYWRVLAVPLKSDMSFRQSCSCCWSR